MAKTGYTAVTGTSVALTPATAQSILGIKSHANFALDVQGLWCDFDGVTSSATPVLVEFCYSTFATNSPGTNSTSITPLQVYGRVIAVGATAAKTWTTEPTVLTVLDSFSLDPNKGLFRYDWPLGQTPDSDLATGFVLRFTAAASVNVRAGLRVERA